MAARTGFDADAVGYILRLVQLDPIVPYLVKLSAAAIVVATQAQGGVTTGPPGQGPSKDGDKDKAMSKGKHKKAEDPNTEVTFVLCSRPFPLYRDNFTCISHIVPQGYFRMLGAKLAHM